jgi:hypothetical protein
MLARWTLALVAAALLVPQGAAPSSTLDPDPCGDRKELERAKRALSGGDRAAALAHLKRARSLLEACKRAEPGESPRAPASERLFS